MADEYFFVGECNKNALEYKLNELMVFTIEPRNGEEFPDIPGFKKYKWTIKGDDGREETGNCSVNGKEPLVVSTALSRPGFVRVMVEACDEKLNPIQRIIAEHTNKEEKKGILADALVGADVFIGVSAARILSVDMIKSMAENPIIFALANPTPEIMPDEAIKAGAAVVATGRSDFPNQVNNVLAFPGIFRGALDVRATDINDDMKIAAAKAIAAVVEDNELSADYIIPDIFNKNVLKNVSEAVKEAARKSGVARL